MNVTDADDKRIKNVIAWSKVRWALTAIITTAICGTVVGAAWESQDRLATVEQKVEDHLTTMETDQEKIDRIDGELDKHLPLINHKLDEMKKSLDEIQALLRED